MRKYRAYSDEDVIKFAKEVKSIAGLLTKLDLKRAGGNYASIKRILQRLKVDCAHWTGQAWSKDCQLKDWSQYTRSINLKKHLIRLRGHRCEECTNEVWLKLPINLETHHIDGDKTNNEPENLKLLCPNCHSCTDSFRRPRFLDC